MNNIITINSLISLEQEIYKYNDILKTLNLFSNEYNYNSTILNQLIKQYEQGYKQLYNKYPKQFMKQLLK